MCILGKKFIDVKNSCTVTSFSWDTEVSSLSPQILHSNVCLYIFEGFFLEKRKIGLLDIVEIENNKKSHFLKNVSAFERTIHTERISRWSLASPADL